MSLPTWLARLPSLLAEQSRLDNRLLDATRWSHAARCERQRVDRNGSSLCILSIALPKSLTTGRALRLLEDYLRERLRITDTPGWRPDGRLGVLLPDTSRSGGELVAREILEFLDQKHGLLEAEVRLYPDDHESDRQTPVEDEVVAPEQSAPVGAATGGESYFAQPLPFWKRSLDIVGSSTLLLAFSPVLISLACAVAATSRGGAFYRQEREGLAGKRFKMLKLRTMIADADRIKHRLRKHSVQDGPAFKMYRDPRVTPIGRLLRSTSLDELPQLFNVLLGDMSLVGPRPLPVEESLACEPWQRQRLQVSPGITCTWQVTGRNTVSFDEWMRMDMRYAKRRTFWQDLKLIATTPAAVLLKRGPR